MCGITGIVSKKTRNNNIGSMLKKMLETLQHRGPDGAGFMIDGIVERKERLNELHFGDKKGGIAIGHVRLAITGGMKGIQPFQSKDKKLTLLHNGEIYNYQRLRAMVHDEYLFETDTDSEVIIRLIEKYYEGDLSKAVMKVLPHLDGVYALAITDNKQVVLARDRIGVRQIYYCPTQRGTAFASEKKPLMRITRRWDTIQRLLPGQVAVLYKDTIHCSTFWNANAIRTKDCITKKEDALKTYALAIEESIRKRITGRSSVGIIFSGGIDSLLIAYMVDKMGVPVTCYTAGFAIGSRDIEWARKIAKLFQFSLKIKRLIIDDIEALIPHIIRDIEDYSFNQVEVAVPIYASVRMAQENGERVLLTGQGADELFGGYSWYSKIVAQEGHNVFEQRSWEDTLLLYKECLEREDKIAMAHSIELRVPFLDPMVIKAAFQIAPQLKIENGSDTLRKRIHRQYCLSVGISKDIAFRKKEAAQHGANVHNVFKELASGQGITKSLMDHISYNPAQREAEVLGSSSRYGHRYGDAHLWESLTHVQYYLDSYAYSLNLLPPQYKSYFKQISSEVNKQRCISRR